MPPIWRWTRPVRHCRRYHTEHVNMRAGMVTGRLLVGRNEPGLSGGLQAGDPRPVPGYPGRVSAAGAPPLSVQRAVAPSDAGGPVTSGSFPRHARRSGVARWAGQRAEPAPPGRVLADGDREASRPAVRFDPLIHPVAITGRCVIGDQIRVPAAWCAVAGCQAAFADPAALGEADNRARAVASGWAKDALGRLACPACQRDHPVPAWWVFAREPGTAGDRGPATGTAQLAGGTDRSVRPAVGGPSVAGQGRPHRTPWPRVLSALVSSRDGWTAGGSRIPDAGTMPGRARTSAPRHGRAVHAAGSAGRRTGRAGQ